MNTIIRYIFSALIVVFSAFNLNAISYYDFDDKGLCFNILSENTVEVTHRSGQIAQQASYATGDVKIPEEVTHRYTDNQHNLVEKTYSVIRIGSNAFSGCKYMESLTIPETVTSIGDNVFYDCDALESIVIPNSVTVIGNGTFKGIHNLKTITFGTSVKEIGWQTFLNSKNIKDIYFLSQMPPKCHNWDYSVSGDMGKIAVLHVPTGCLEAYADDDFWGHFENIVEHEISSISNPTIHQESVKVSIEGDSLIINGVNDDEDVTIYNVNGQIAYRGKYRVIRGLPTGLYFVHYSQNTVKVLIP